MSLAETGPSPLYKESAILPLYSMTAGVSVDLILQLILNFLIFAWKDSAHTGSAKGMEITVLSQNATSPSQTKYRIIMSCRGEGIT